MLSISFFRIDVIIGNVIILTKYLTKREVLGHEIICHTTKRHF
ncbi:hypothetical protein STFR1_30054 [Bacillus vallismortis]